MEKVALGWIDSGSVRGEFTHSVLALAQLEAGNPNPRYELVDFIRWSGPYVADNRNKLCEDAIEAGHDWLLMIDCDESFQPDVLRVLMRSADPVSRPIVTGIYVNTMGVDATGGVTLANMVFSEGPNGGYHALQPEGPEPFRVDAFGTGIVLIHLPVLERIPKPWFWLEQIRLIDRDEPQLVGEDIAFCRKAREAGIDLWCDPLAEATHWKTMPLIASTVGERVSRMQDAKQRLMAAAGHDPAS